MNVEKRKNLIKSKIAELGITQREIAKELKINPNSLWRWINQNEFDSAKIENYFRQKFGEQFIRQIRMAA